MTTHRPPVVLMTPDEVLPLKRACARARRSADTLRRWGHEYGIARQAGPSAPLEFSAVALEMVLHGDWPALEELRAGRRSHTSVARYLEHLGLPA